MTQPETIMWWQRPPHIAPFRTVAELRNAALITLRQRPDLCRWQEQASEAERHVTAYCLLTDKLDHMEFALGDTRLDELDVTELAEHAGRDLLYLYDTFAFHAEQLLRELDYLLPSSKRQRDSVTDKIKSYVNNLTKHRADRGNTTGPYVRDHHAVLSFADFESVPHEPGISDDGQLWGVPSLLAVTQHVRERVIIFDQALEDAATRTAVENTRSIPWP